MILVYHKVAPKKLSDWYVSVSSFKKQINELKNYNFVYLNDYNSKNRKQIVITFDDGYKNVVRYAAPFLYKNKVPFEYFVTGSFIGKYNSWQKVEPTVKMSNISDLEEITRLGGRLQWHTLSHPNFSVIKERNTISKEVVVPAYLRNLDKKGFQWFAYPYGIYNDYCYKLVQKYYTGAVSCTNGDNTNRHLLTRLTMRDNISFKEATPEIYFYINQLEVKIINSDIRTIQAKKTNNSSVFSKMRSLKRKLMD